MVHIQHRVHVTDPDKNKHFATMRLVFLAQSTNKLAKAAIGWLPVDGFEKTVPTVLARESKRKSLGQNYVKLEIYDADWIVIM